MSLEHLARTSTSALLEATAARTDTISGRTSLRRTVRIRRRVRAVVAVVALAVLGSVVAVVGAVHHHPQPVAPHHPAAIIVLGADGLYAVDPASGASPLLLQLGADYEGDIVGASPDGTQVAYDSGGSPQVYDRAGALLQSLPVPAGWQSAVRWTSHGVRVARFDVRRQLTVADVVDGHLVAQQIYRPDLPDFDPELNVLPSWSPDGTRLAVSAAALHDVRQLFVMDADGSDVRELDTHASTGGVGQVAWSPDGRRIAFMDWSRQRAHLMVINPDGTHLIDLGAVGDGIEDKNVGTAIAWSPDSRSIAFLAKDLQQAGWALYVRDPAGAVRLLPISGVVGFTIVWAAGS